MDTNGAGYDAAAAGAGGEAGSEETAVRGKLIGVLRAQRAETRQSATAVVAARGPVSVKQGMAGVMLGTGDASITQGYATCVGTIGAAHVHQGGTQWLFTAKGVDIEQGGALVAAAPRVTMKGGFLGLALAQHVELAEGARPVFTPKSAAVVGAAAGAAFALVSVFGLLQRRGGG